MPSIPHSPQDRFYIGGERRLVLVGLRVNVSHDLGEIACNLMMLFADMLSVAMRYAY